MREQWTEKELAEYRKADDTKWQDDLFAILGRLKATYPQSKIHTTSVTVKAGPVEAGYSVSITRGDL